jgi:hypothetical protein
MSIKNVQIKSKANPGKIFGHKPDNRFASQSSASTPMPMTVRRPSDYAGPGALHGYMGHMTQPQFWNAGHNTSHPGFKAVQSKIASKAGVSKDRAGAILAASSRGASKAAKRKNPRLKRVKG